MGAQSRTTFKKRQKELARMEKQKDKAAKRLERKSDTPDSKPAGEFEIAWEDATTVPFDQQDREPE